MGLKGHQIISLLGPALDPVFWYFNGTSYSGCRGYEKLSFLCPFTTKYSYV